MGDEWTLCRHDIVPEEACIIGSQQFLGTLRYDSLHDQGLVGSCYHFLIVRVPTLPEDHVHVCNIQAPTDEEVPKRKLKRENAVTQKCTGSLLKANGLLEVWIEEKRGTGDGKNGTGIPSSQVLTKTKFLLQAIMARHIIVQFQQDVEPTSIITLNL